MGILRDQAFRLLRENWNGTGGAQELAQELYEIFRSKDPFVIDGPVQIVNNTDDPALSIASNGSDGGGADVFNISRGRDGDVTFTEAFPDVEPPTTTGGSTGGGGFPGTIVSGTGDTYSVQLLSGGTVTATQLQIASGETIPAGTAVNVVKSGARWFIFVPVWL